ncbi:hypothetical protein KAW65_03290 [candidate division WOR-3 bacterium]|nr:hypothetical protein [candidate division WOR-3 bacterium]
MKNSTHHFVGASARRRFAQIDKDKHRLLKNGREIFEKQSEESALICVKKTI